MTELRKNRIVRIVAGRMTWISLPPPSTICIPRQRVIRLEGVIDSLWGYGPESRAPARVPHFRSCLSHCCVSIVVKPHPITASSESRRALAPARSCRWPPPATASRSGPPSSVSPLPHAADRLDASPLPVIASATVNFCPVSGFSWLANVPTRLRCRESQVSIFPKIASAASIWALACCWVAASCCCATRLTIPIAGSSRSW